MTNLTTIQNSNKLKQLRICFIITGLGGGGAEKQLCDLAEMMSNAGHIINIISISGNSKVIPKYIKGKIFEMKTSKNIISIIKCTIDICRLINKLKPDIVHSHMYHANIISRFAALLTGKKKYLICTAHSKNEGGWLRMLSYRITDPLCCLTTNVSSEALDEFIKNGAFKDNKSKRVHNGIDETKFFSSKELRNKYRTDFGCNENEKLILTIGRLVEAKDHQNLLKALPLLHYKNYKLVIVGEGELYEETTSLIKELNLQEKVFLAGYRNDIVGIINSCDLFVLSSRWEGFGLVVAEAMLCEKVVVATDSGGVREVVNDSKQLVPRANHISLAKNIDDMLSLSEDEIKELGRRNREYIKENFSLKKIAEEWENLYINVIERNKHV